MPTRFFEELFTFITHGAIFEKLQYIISRNTRTQQEATCIKHYDNFFHLRIDHMEGSYHLLLKNDLGISKLLLHCINGDAPHIGQMVRYPRKIVRWNHWWSGTLLQFVFISDRPVVHVTMHMEFTCLLWSSKQYQCATWLASFSCRLSHHQFLIACSMQKQRGRPGLFYHVCLPR